MRQLTTFIQKEFMEVCRNNKLMICTIVFFLLGIMNPAIAKLTPWLFEKLSSSYEDMGIILTDVKVNALTSWEQFYKNLPIGMVVFVLMFSSIVASELERGTLINILTKGMARWKILASKGILLLVMWTGCYFLTYGITYVYNDIYWDNAIGKNLFFSALCMYLLGVWLISLILLMSALANHGTGVALGTSVVFLICYLISVIPNVAKYLPTKLMECSQIPFGRGTPDDFTYAIVIIILWSLMDVMIGILVFNKKNI